MRDNFIHNGAARYLAVITAEIKDAVQAEYADRLAIASPLERLRLHAHIRREIRRRITAAVSNRALY